MAIVASTSGNVYRNLGANHHMWTWAELDDSGFLHAVTRTETSTLFGGYTGGARVAVLNSNDIIIAITPEVQFGVQGKAFGNSDRTDGWNHQFASQEIIGAARLAAVQYWAPTWRLFDPLVKIGAAIIALFAG